jgi:Tol biopolymer transport system component
MKKLLLGSASLMLFSIAMAIFQISCKKEASAETNTTSTLQLNKIIYSKILRDTGGEYKGLEIWTANYDGTGQTKVNITLPDGTSFGEGMVPKMSPDGKKVFFTAGPSFSSGSGYSVRTSLYSSNIDGSGVLAIIQGPDITDVGGAY